MILPTRITSWPHKGKSGRLSPREFQQRATSHLTRFRISYQEVLNTRHILATSKMLLPSDCDQAIDNLENLQQSIRSFDVLLNSSERLPENVIPNRYSVLFSLHYLEELSCQLIPLFRSLRKVCMDSSPEASRLQSQIQKKLGIITQTGEKVEPASEAILDLSNMSRSNYD